MSFSILYNSTTLSAPFFFNNSIKMVRLKSTVLVFIKGLNKSKALLFVSNLSYISETNGIKENGIEISFSLIN